MQKQLRRKVRVKEFEFQKLASINWDLGAKIEIDGGRSKKVGKHGKSNRGKSIW